MTGSFAKLLEYGERSFNGNFPSSALLKAKDGKLYGFTEKGGIHDDGTLYQFDPTTFTYTKKYDFIDSISGSIPVGS